MTNLTRTQRKELRELGWSVSRKRARRPRRMPDEIVPSINQTDTVDVYGGEEVELESEV